LRPTAWQNTTKLGTDPFTETFGVKALAAELSKKFKLPWKFLHHPSGL
jgi:hypothetical protein